MNRDEAFLARWSRRKRNAAAGSDAAKNPPPRAAEIGEPVSPIIGEAAPAIPLPSIESIEAASDIKAFLAPGVPPELTRAALRRVWTVDPVIREFIGLSENAWDFNAAGGVPGFGSLDLEEVRRLVAQVLEEPPLIDPTSVTAAVAADPAIPPETDKTAPTSEVRQSIAAARHQNAQTKAREGRPPRCHGGALPQ